MRILFLALLLHTAVTRHSHADDSFYDLPPPGQRVDIGGYKLHIHCQGTGSPTVILDAGLGDWSSHWASVQALLKGDTQVCSYDRAGYGWSDPGPRPRASAQLATELHALLKKAEIPPPYVLVGHSFGGFNMRLFSTTFDDEVVGLVLVDASHAGSLPYRRDENGSGSNPAASNYRVLMVAAQADILKLPPEAIPAVHNDFLHTKSIATARSEYRALADSVSQVQQAPGLGDIPLIVISRGIHEWGESAEGAAREASWQAQQDELVRLSRRGTHKIASRSGHHIHLDEPGLVADAIRELVVKAREEQVPTGGQP
ncbi:MAG TPA: alpha/beta hydrolase [Methylophilaceae bacterium]|nr:alpha/beta hydrolase [Methylophilaceae bacterium]